MWELLTHLHIFPEIQPAEESRSRMDGHMHIETSQINIPNSIS